MDNLVGAAIKQARELNRISTYDIARKTGISQSTISKLENGKRKADIEILKKIAPVLHKQPAELLEGPIILRDLMFDEIMKRGMTIEGLSKETKLSAEEIENVLVSVDIYNPENLYRVGAILGLSKGFITKSEKFDNVSYQHYGFDYLKSKLLDRFENILRRSNSFNETQAEYKAGISDNAKIGLGYIDYVNKTLAASRKDGYGEQLEDDEVAIVKAALEAYRRGKKSNKKD